MRKYENLEILSKTKTLKNCDHKHISFFKRVGHYFDLGCGYPDYILFAKRTPKPRV